MATLSIGFNLSASAVGMAQGINAGVVELQKLGVAAKKASDDVALLKNLEISQVFVGAVETISSAFTSFADGAINAVASTSNLSKVLGVAYEDMRRLQLAAEFSGVSAQALAAAFLKAQLTFASASSGSKDAIASFEKLGLSLADLSKQGSNERFATIASAIAQITDPATRASVAVSILGKSGAELAPFFGDLSKSLENAQTFLDKFSGGLSAADAGQITALGASFREVQQAVQEVAGKVLAQLSPAIREAAGQLVDFLAKLDIAETARQTKDSVMALVSGFTSLAQACVPLAGNALPAIGAYLAFINRQAIAAGIAGLARAFLATASAAVAYSTGALTASAATAMLATSVRGLLASTGIGALAVVLGLAAGALADWALSGKESAQEITIAVQDPTKGVEEFNKSLQASIGNIQNVGREAKAAFNLDDVLDTGVTQTFIDQAQGAFKALAVQLNGVAAIPEDLQAQFAGLQSAVDALNADRAGGIVTASSENAVVTQAQRLLAAIQSITEARKRDADAAKDAADAAKRAADEARQRTRELATAGLSEAEKSRLQLNKDLLAITQEQRAAEEALAAAKRARDAEGIKAARERLTLAQSAVVEAKAQDRDRQLQALGIDQRILQPARTIADEFQAVRDAFNKQLINPEQFGIALRNLADEGIKIRGELARELAKPAQRALEVSDIRTPEGMRQFMALNRQDPAIEQRAQQLQKLDEIRKELVKINVQPVDILS